MAASVAVPKMIHWTWSIVSETDVRRFGETFW